MKLQINTENFHPCKPHRRGRSLLRNKLDCF